MDAPGSVFGWAMSLGVPIIYVEFGMYCLSPDVETAFRDGVFFIDGRVEGWEGRLRALLELPPEELVAHFKAKESGRKLLFERYIFGPGGSSAKRAADYMGERLKLSPRRLAAA
jgi:hypothetical protein